MESGIWSLELGIWSLESGAWGLESAACSLESGVRSLEAGAWSLEFCNLEPGAWLQTASISTVETYGFLQITPQNVNFTKQIRRSDSKRLCFNGWATARNRKEQWSQDRVLYPYRNQNPLC